MRIAVSVLLMCLTASWVYEVECRLSVRRDLVANPSACPVFDVTKYGAVGDGSPATNEDGDSANSLAFIQAWRAACDSTAGATRVIIPKGNFMIGPVLFGGPCKSSVTVEIQGNVIANPDITLYSESFLLAIENVQGFTLTGTGSVDGNGPKVWGLNDCRTNSHCAPLPTSIRVMKANNSLIEGVQTLNPMFFHMFISNSFNVTVQNMKINAPANSPNTDGIHIGSSDFVTVKDTAIATGDDCVSFGHGTRNATVTGVTCGPGHGISVGSLGKYDDEAEVVGVLVKNCTFIGTTNGARIKTWPGNKNNKASAITYEDLVMDHVQYPVIIDQKYGKEDSDESSHVKVTDVHFKNIRGTSITKALTTFICSPILPCDGIEVTDINLSVDSSKIITRKKDPPTPATCTNAKVVFSGQHEGLGC